MRAKTQATLVEFVEKADEIRSGRLWQFLLRSDNEVELSFGLDGSTGCLIESEIHGPDSDALAAVLLPLRMFRQESDPISFQAVRKQLREDRGALPADVLGKVSDEFATAERQLSLVVLEASDIPAVPELAEGVTGRNGLRRPVTQQDVFKTFLYGHYAHLDEELRPRYLEWRRSPRFPFFQFVFVATASGLLCTIFNVADLLRPHIRASGNSMAP